MLPFKLWENSNRTEGFGNHPRMTHQIGRVLVARGSDCGIIDPFESKTGVDTEAARFLPCNTLVLPPAECVWTIISCGAMVWQPAPEILDRNTVVLFQYIAILAGCVIIASLKHKRHCMKTLYEITVKLTVYADSEIEAHSIIEDGVDDIVKNSDTMQYFYVSEIDTVLED